MTLLRPEWLLALPLVIWFLLQQRQTSRLRWQHHIDDDLLKPLIRPQADLRARWFRRWAAGSLLLLPLILAGPAVEQSTDETLTERPMVIMLDQSPSMLATDLSPDRHTRARQKIQDWLRANPERPAALVAYSGTAHVAAPLTFDHAALTTLLQQLSPSIMPVPGSDPVAAMNLALTQLQGNRGDILWLTDDLTAEQRVRFPEFEHSGQQLGIITLGTEQGAPIRLSSNQVLMDQAGQVIEPGLDTSEISILADHSAIRWQPLALDNSDWQRALPAQSMGTGGSLADSQTITRDLGPWLLLLLLPGLLLFYRRGHMLTLVVGSGLALTLSFPTPVQASPLDWFRSPDQRGYARLAEDPGAALAEFRSAEWQIVAALEAGQYQYALDLLEGREDAISRYHQGNALVHLQRYEDAIVAYEAALEIEPDFEEAAQNLALVQEFLEQPPPAADADEPPPPPEDSQPGDSDSRGDGPMTPGEADPDSGSPSTGAEQAEADAMAESIRRRLPEPDASFLERKFRYQYEVNPEQYDDTGPAW